MENVYTEPIMIFKDSEGILKFFNTKNYEKFKIAKSLNDYKDLLGSKPFTIKRFSDSIEIQHMVSYSDKAEDYELLKKAKMTFTCIKC